MIRGFDDHLRIQRLGKIRLGVKKQSKSGTEYPQAVDYFVCPPEVREIYGEKPRRLDVIIPHDNMEAIFPTSLKRYGSQRGLICRGNGQQAQCQIEGSDDFQEIECSYKDCKHYQQGNCKEVGNLQVILPEVRGVLGVYQIDTSSYNSILNIKSGLEVLRRTVGRFSMIPLLLEVEMQQVNPLTAEGKRLTTTVPVMTLKHNSTFYEVLEKAREQRLVQQVSAERSSKEKIAIENPGLDEKPELLYPGVMEERNKGDDEVVAATTAADNTDQELNKLWDRLGTPPAKRKAVLGKPDLNKEALMEYLREEIRRRKKENEEKDEREDKKEQDNRVFF